MADESTEQMGGKRSAWMSHVKKTMKAHKGMKLMQVLKLAKKTYKKSKKGGALAPASVESAPAPAGETQKAGRRHRRGSKKTRKGSRKH